MKFVPDYREDVAKYVSDNSRDDDENYCCGNVEGLDGVDRRDEMHPEDEINERLRVVECDKCGPDRVEKSEHCA